MAERVTTSFEVDDVQRGSRRNRTLEGTLELQGKFLCADPDFFQGHRSVRGIFGFVVVLVRD